MSIDDRGVEETSSVSAQAPSQDGEKRRKFLFGKAAVEAALAEEADLPPLPKPLSAALKVFGWIMMFLGLENLLLGVFVAVVLPLVLTSGDAAELNSTLILALSIVQLFFMLAIGLMSLRLGRALRKGIRRKTALWARRLAFTNIASMVIAYCLAGPSTVAVVSVVEVVVLIVLGITIDPRLAAERKAERGAQLQSDMADAEAGMLGRDKSGKGYLRLDFFNLFWMFFICCILGLILEIIWHMVVVEPGVYEDRAGLLIGPFSPIYGFGAVLITLALNRLYNKNLVLTFVVAGIVGAAFEWAVAVFMKLGFGVTAWDYTSYTFFGLIPDPIAVISSGRTATMFVCIWGVLGVVWVKLFLPVMLKGVNLMPWKLRYWLTGIVAVLMLANGLLTLGSLDCWFERASGLAPTSPIQEFYATYCNDEFMQNRFQSMTMNVEDSTRTDVAQEVAAEEAAA